MILNKKYVYMHALFLVSWLLVSMLYLVSKRHRKAIKARYQSVRL